MFPKTETTIIIQILKYPAIAKADVAVKILPEGIGKIAAAKKETINRAIYLYNRMYGIICSIRNSISS